MCDRNWQGCPPQAFCNLQTTRLSATANLPSSLNHPQAHRCPGEFCAPSAAHRYFIPLPASFFLMLVFSRELIFKKRRHGPPRLFLNQAQKREHGCRSCSCFPTAGPRRCCCICCLCHTLLSGGGERREGSPVTPLCAACHGGLAGPTLAALLPGPAARPRRSVCGADQGRGTSRCSILLLC